MYVVIQVLPSHIFCSIFTVLCPELNTQVAKAQVLLILLLLIYFLIYNLIYFYFLLQISLVHNIFIYLNKDNLNNFYLKQENFHCLFSAATSDCGQRHFFLSK